jgi:diguanylate cyclase (GGDEF)-like protein
VNTPKSKRLTDVAVAARVAQALTSYGDHPLSIELDWLAKKYQRLHARFVEATSISGALQASPLASNLSAPRRAQSDSLTGLLNREGFLHSLRAACGRLGETGNAFGLIMLDIDVFRHINETCGHQAGDDALVRVGAEIVSIVGSASGCSRWSGAEFFLLVDARTDTQLRATAEQLHTAVLGVIAVGRGRSMPLRVSMGTYFCSSVEEPAELVRKADAALYRAKLEQRGGIRNYA